MNESKEDRRGSLGLALARARGTSVTLRHSGTDALRVVVGGVSHEAASSDEAARVVASAAALLGVLGGES